MKGFSLLELLVTGALITLLLVLSFAGFQKVSEQGRLTKCLSNIREISTVMIAYAAERNGAFPRWISDREPVPKGARPGASGGTDSGTTWMRELLDAGLITTTSAAWKCPGDVSTRSLYSYSFNANVAGHTLGNISQPGNTILLSERYDKVAYKLFDLRTYAALPNSQGIANEHGNKVICTFVDGHGEILSLNKIPPQLDPPDSRWILKD